MPEKAGLYFAKTTYDGWDDLIIAVQGTAPMLYIDYALQMSGADSPKIRHMKPFQIAEWGKLIEV